MLGGFKEDAAVYSITPSLALVQTIDFITPILDDPYSFGAVAAANALSDIYAMGANPVFALNIVNFPVRSLPLEVLKEILRGGSDKALEAGICVAGGHSVEAAAPSYGMTVTGLVDPNKMIRKKGAQNGDLLILTKPVGTGIVTTALDRGLAGAREASQVFELMASLNKSASEAMVKVGVNACTDVTGFGLLGHLYELLKDTGLSAEIYCGSVPVLPEAHEYIEAGAVPGGTHSNYQYVKEQVSWQESVLHSDKLLLCDAQTSGGLLIAVSAEKADQLVAALEGSGNYAAARIGKIVNEQEKKMSVLP